MGASRTSPRTPPPATTRGVTDAPREWPATYTRVAIDAGRSLEEAQRRAGVLHVLALEIGRDGRVALDVGPLVVAEGGDPSAGQAPSQVAQRLVRPHGLVAILGARARQQDHGGNRLLRGGHGQDAGEADGRTGNRDRRFARVFGRLDGGLGSRNKPSPHVGHRLDGNPRAQQRPVAGGDLRLHQHVPEVQPVAAQGDRLSLEGTGRVFHAANLHGRRHQRLGHHGRDRGLGVGGEVERAHEQVHLRGQEIVEHDGAPADRQILRLLGLGLRPFRRGCLQDPAVLPAKGRHRGLRFLAGGLDGQGVAHDVCG